MKIRAKSNGNELDLSDEEAEQLLNTGIYEKVEDRGTQPVTQVDPGKSAKKQAYRTRDMQAE